MNTIVPNFTVTPELEELRAFIERGLGFGDPIQSDNLFSVFAAVKQEDVLGLRYGSRNGYAHASLNTITEVDWVRIHANEKGIVHYDVLVGAEARLQQFLKREMAKQGFKLLETIDPRDGERLKKILEALNSFKEYFVNTYAAGTKFPSSFTMRRNIDGGPNWDMTLRLGIFTTDNASAYIEFTFPNLLETVATLITDDQINTTANTAYGFVAASREPEKLILGKLKMMDWSKMLVETILHQGQELTAEGFYIGYSSMVKANLAAVQNATEWNYVNALVPWEELSVLDKRIISDAVELARWHIVKFISNNTSAAHEEA